MRRPGPCAAALFVVLVELVLFFRTPPMRAARGTRPPTRVGRTSEPRDFAQPGSIFSPCTAPSAYMRERIAILEERSTQHGDDTATRCLNGLSPGQFAETMEAQYGQDMFIVRFAGT